MVTTGFADTIARRISTEHTLLAARWFARLNDLLPVNATEVFPSDQLLDHIPALIVDLSEYLRAPEEQAIAANTTVIEKARELGTLRHQQRASLHQVLREYQLLGAILVRYVQDETMRLMLSPSPAECMAVVSRIHQSVNLLLQETVETFVSLYTRTITDQAERLHQFTRMATHEWRQPLAPIVTAVSLLKLQPGLPPAQQAQVIEMIGRNVSTLVEMTHTLERLARLNGPTDNPSLQRMPIHNVAAEAARQLREMADARQVSLRIDDDLPDLAVDVGRLELALLNLLSNAIKYSDASKPDRFVHVTAWRLDGHCAIRVQDNGVGIPSNRIDSVFRRFTRAHTDRAELEFVKGVGLGLAIVDDCVQAMGGTITVESREGDGTTFELILPDGAPLTGVADVQATAGRTAVE
jgi:signal transduction histidine kinase